MITGELLIGLLFALVYRQIRKTMAAFQGPQRLPIMTFEVGKAACTQTVAISERKPQCGCHLGKTFGSAKEYGSFGRPEWIIRGLDVDCTILRVFRYM